MKTPRANSCLAQSLRRIALLSCLWALPLSVFAEILQWETETQSFQTEFGEKSVTASYPFSNNGATSVTIVKSSASCGCTVPTLDKKVYEPGENGELTAIFTIGSRQGKQHKTITVETQSGDGNTETYQLKLEVDIPVPIVMKPRVRFWKVGSEPTPQEVLISFHEKFPMTIKEIGRRNSAETQMFDHQLETLVEGREYKLTITPRDIGTKSRDTFFIVSEQDESQILKRYPIYAYVR